MVARQPRHSDAKASASVQELSISATPVGLTVRERGDRKELPLNTDAAAAAATQQTSALQLLLQSSRQILPFFHRSPGRLQRALRTALRDSAGSVFKFLTNDELERLVTHEFVLRELERHEISLRVKKKLASKNSPKKRSSGPVEHGQHTKASKSIRVGIVSRVFSFEQRQNKVDTLARQICGIEKSPGGELLQYRRVFAILVIMGIPQKIKRFVKGGISDACIPLDAHLISNQIKFYRRLSSHCDEVKSTLSSHRAGDYCYTAQAHESTGKASSPKPLKCFRGWSIERKHIFEDKQWVMAAPKFDRGGLDDPAPIRHLSLHTRHILPFLSLSREEFRGRNGGFGEVYKVEIHKAHHSFGTPEGHTPGQPQYFAIKKLHSPSEKDFKREVSTLKILSAVNHEHLISLLATYKQNGQYHLIFHWAESDLLSYWEKRNPSPVVDHHLIQWLAEQCAGLASAVLLVHKPDEATGNVGNSLRHLNSVQSVLKLAETEFDSHSGKSDLSTLDGYHGDIKSTNVLLFRRKNGGNGACKWTLKLSDFGLAGFRATNTASVANTPIYAPPELFLRPTSPVDPSYDIWMLGCLYLEFVTWLLGGWKMLEDFERMRVSDDGLATFYSIKGDEHGIVEMLQQHEKCNDYIRKFLTMVNDHMLIVEMDDEGATGNRRYDCDSVERSLRERLHDCLD